MLLYGVSAQPIITNLPSYKEADAACEKAISTGNTMYTESQLAIYNGETYSHTRAIEEHLNRKLADQTDSLENTGDIFLYFYTVYAPSHLTGPNGEKYDYTIEKVNKEIYMFDFQEDTILWCLRENNYNLPLKLTDEAVNQITRYRNNEIDANSEKYFVAFNKQANTMMENAARLLLDSKEYREARVLYNENSAKVLIHYSYSAIIIYTVLFAVYYVVFPLLVGDGKTLGKYLLGYSCFTVDRHYTNKKNVILRAVLQYLSYFFVAGFLPFLFVGLNVFSMPVLIIGDYSLSMIIPMLVSLLLSVVSFFIMTTSASWQSLADLCSKTIVGKIEETPVDELEGGEDNGK